MSKHKNYLAEYSSIWGKSEEDEKTEKIDGYESEVYDDMEKVEDEITENNDLYEVFSAINKVLENPLYTSIQTITPSMDVNNESLHIYAVTKDSCPENEGILQQYVKDLQAATESKLKFKAQIDEEELDGLKKFQMRLIVTRKK